MTENALLNDQGLRRFAALQRYGMVLLGIRKARLHLTQQELVDTINQYVAFKNEFLKKTEASHFRSPLEFVSHSRLRALETPAHAASFGELPDKFKLHEPRTRKHRTLVEFCSMQLGRDDADVLALEAAYQDVLIAFGSTIFIHVPATPPHVATD